MLTTDSCCCCIELRTGCLIIGWLQLICPAISLISSIVVPHHMADNGFAPDKQTDDNDNQDAAAEFWSNAVISVFQIMAAFCLLFGVYASRKRFVYFYLFVQSACAVLMVLSAIVIFFFGASGAAGAIIIADIIVLALIFYVIVVVYSYYIKM